jgi:hypothetical protein
MKKGKWDAHATPEDLHDRDTMLVACKILALHAVEIHAVLEYPSPVNCDRDFDVDTVGERLQQITLLLSVRTTVPALLSLNTEGECNPDCHNCSLVSSPTTRHEQGELTWLGQSRCVCCLKHTPLVNIYIVVLSVVSTWPISVQDSVAGLTAKPVSAYAYRTLAEAGL